MSPILGEILKIVPKNHLSYVVGKMVHTELPQKWSNKSIKWFVDRYGINMEEAELPLEDYKSIGDVFTRRLKKGIRPIASGSVVHPADAVLTTRGEIDIELIIQAKGKRYSICDLLKDNEALEKYVGGTYLTYYLCPTDYHRVHCPIDARVKNSYYVPGQLWPVNSWSVENVTHLFTLNERMIVNLESELGEAALVMVGATNVGKISLAFDSEQGSQKSFWSAKSRKKEYEHSFSLKKGDEVGTFHMGSTVIMLYSKGYGMKDLGTEPIAVKMGGAL